MSRLTSDQREIIALLNGLPITAWSTWRPETPEQQEWFVKTSPSLAREIIAGARVSLTGPITPNKPYGYSYDFGPNAGIIIRCPGL